MAGWAGRWTAARSKAGCRTWFTLVITCLAAACSTERMPLATGAAGAPSNLAGAGSPASGGASTTSAEGGTRATGGAAASMGGAPNAMPSASIVSGGSSSATPSAAGGASSESGGSSSVPDAGTPVSEAGATLFGTAPSFDPDVVYIVSPRVDQFRLFTVGGHAGGTVKLPS